MKLPDDPNPALPCKRIFPTAGEQLAVYSFRCPKMMDHYMEHLMNDHTVNRTQVIRLGVYMLACFSQWEENKGVSLHELVRRMEERSPESFPDFEEFCRRSGLMPSPVAASGGRDGAPRHPAHAPQFPQA